MNEKTKSYRNNIVECADLWCVTNVVLGFILGSANVAYLLKTTKIKTTSLPRQAASAGI